MFPGLSKQTSVFVLFSAIAVVFVSYWVITQVGGGGIAIQPKGVEEQGIAQQNAPFQQVLNDPAALSAQQSEKGGKDSAQQADPNNLTQRFVSDMSAQFMSQFNQDPNASVDTLLDRVSSLDLKSVDGLSEQLTPEAIGLQLPVLDSQLSIVSDNDQSSAAYAKAYSQIVGRAADISNSKEVINAMSSAIEGNNAGDLKTLSLRYIAIKQDLLSTQVPRKAVAFHKRTIQFFGDMAVIMEAIAQSRQDPLRAYIAVEYFPRLAEEWDTLTTLLKENTPLSIF